MTVAVSLCPTAGVFAQFFTTGGLPLNAGLLYQYAAGSTTPQATYTTSAGSVQNANPIVLGADGRPANEIWLVNGSAYRFDLYDSASNLIASYDNVSGIAAAISGAYLPTSGGTMSGNIAMGANKVTGLAAATAAGDAVRYEQSPAGILAGKGALIGATAANTPVSITVGSNGQTLVANSSNANGVTWGSPVLMNYLTGCTLSTAGSSGTMSIAAGTAVDSTNVAAMSLAAIAKTTSAWAVGTAQGGLDTGAIANSTWYAWYVIQRPDTGVVDVLFSTSASAPTLPTNYTLFRRIGWGLTDGSAHWVKFFQVLGQFRWDVPVNDLNDNAATTTRVSKVVTAAPSCDVLMSLALASTAAGVETVLFTALAQTDTAPSTTVATIRCGSSAAGGTSSSASDVRITLNSSSQLGYRRNTASTTIEIVTLGWIDSRGQ